MYNHISYQNEQIYYVLHQNEIVFGSANAQEAHGFSEKLIREEITRLLLRNGRDPHDPVLRRLVYIGLQRRIVGDLPHVFRSEELYAP